MENVLHKFSSITKIYNQTNTQLHFKYFDTNLFVKASQNYMGNKRYLGENAQSEEEFLQKTLSHNVIKIYWLHLLNTAN